MKNFSVAKYAMYFAVALITFASTDGSAATRKEILEMCGGIAKEAAREALLAEDGVVRMTQRTTWLSGYSPSEQLMPIFTVLMDFEMENSRADYGAYRVTTRYFEDHCTVVEIQKEPL